MSTVESNPGTAVVETSPTMSPAPPDSTPEPPRIGADVDIGRAESRPTVATGGGVAGTGAGRPEGGAFSAATGAGATRPVLHAVRRQLMDNAIVILLTGIVIAVVSFGFDSLGDRIDDTNTSLSARIDSLDTSLNARIDSLDTSLNARIDDTNTSLSARIDSLDTSLNARIDSLDDTDTSLSARIDSLDTSLNARIDSLGDRIDDTNTSLSARIDSLDTSLGDRIGELGRAVAENGQRLARIEGFLGIGMPEEAAARAPGAALAAEPAPVLEGRTQAGGQPGG